MLIATSLLFWQILVPAAAVTILAYIIGDILILPRSNNLAATISDLVMAFLVIFVFRYFSGYAGISVVDAVACAVFICIAEWFFHRYMASKVLEDRKN
jgi:hypothetical protein